MIERRAEAEVARALRRFPVVAVLGPRQVGKTTLARTFASRSERDVDHLDLERPSHLARRLEPYHANLGKRLVRSPKAYLRASGLLHAISDIGSTDDLLGHPVAGASWEGFVCEQVLGVHRPREACFYRSAGDDAPAS